MAIKRPVSTSAQLPLPVGAKIVAVRDFGPIRSGAAGMITGTAREPFLQGNRPVYVCTFADNMKSLARPRDVDSSDHDYSIDDLESPNSREALAHRKAAETKVSAA